jgi:hypothetical protein
VGIALDEYDGVQEHLGNAGQTFSETVFEKNIN